MALFSFEGTALPLLPFPLTILEATAFEFPREIHFDTSYPTGPVFGSFSSCFFRYPKSLTTVTTVRRRETRQLSFMSPWSPLFLTPRALQLWSLSWALCGPSCGTHLGPTRRTHALTNLLWTIFFLTPLWPPLFWEQVPQYTLWVARFPSESPLETQFQSSPYAAGDPVIYACSMHPFSPPGVQPQGCPPPSVNAPFS